MTEPLLDLAEKPEDDGLPQKEGGQSGVGNRVDERNRYKIPNPDTGKPARWTRATNFAKTLAETEGLQRWAERHVAKGIAERPDLLARVERTPLDQSRVLDAIARDAKTAAGAWKKAGYGTTFHRLTERVDLGELDPVKAGPPWGPMLRAYVEVLDQAGIKILPEYVEQTVVVKQYKVAGTFDRIVQMPNGELWIADLKTGRDLSWSWGEIAIQLALYAHADGIYDFDTREFRPMPEVDQVQALVIHAPVEGDFVSLERVNVEIGWQAAELCERVRNFRRFKNINAPVIQVKVEDDPNLPRRWVSRIVAATTVHDLSLIWREANAEGEWTKELEQLGLQRKEEIERG